MANTKRLLIGFIGLLIVLIIAVGIGAIYTSNTAYNGAAKNYGSSQTYATEAYAQMNTQQVNINTYKQEGQSPKQDTYSSKENSYNQNPQSPPFQITTYNTNYYPTYGYGYNQYPKYYYGGYYRYYKPVYPYPYYPYGYPYRGYNGGKKIWY